MADETARGRVEAFELTRLQQAAARRAAEARATMPDFTASAPLGAAPGDGPLLHAVAVALEELPQLNGAYRDGQVERYSRINVAVALPGPVAPTLFDANSRSEAELAAALAALRARDPESFTAAELAGATFTVHGLGTEGLSSLTPVLVPRQAAGLGVAGAHLSLVCDARALGATDAAAFLARVRAALA